jgi:hypothetical protein
MLFYAMHAGPSREILQGGTRLLWNPGDRLRLLNIVENTPKNKKIKIKRLWLWGPSEIHKPHMMVQVIGSLLYRNNITHTTTSVSRRLNI